jgi:hypothetical protein
MSPVGKRSNHLRAAPAIGRFATVAFRHCHPHLYYRSWPATRRVIAAIAGQQSSQPIDWSGIELNAGVAANW